MHKTAWVLMQTLATNSSDRFLSTLFGYEKHCCHCEKVCAMHPHQTALVYYKGEVMYFAESNMYVHYLKLCSIHLLIYESEQK